MNEAVHVYVAKSSRRCLRADVIADATENPLICPSGNPNDEAMVVLRFASSSAVGSELAVIAMLTSMATMSKAVGTGDGNEEGDATDTVEGSGTGVGTKEGMLVGLRVICIVVMLEPSTVAVTPLDASAVWNASSASAAATPVVKSELVAYVVSDRGAATVNKAVHVYVAKSSRRRPPGAGPGGGPGGPPKSSEGSVGPEPLVSSVGAAGSLPSPSSSLVKTDVTSNPVM